MNDAALISTYESFGYNKDPVKSRVRFCVGSDGENCLCESVAARENVLLRDLPPRITPPLLTW